MRKALVLIAGWCQWTYVKRMTINPGHALYDACGGIHRPYANPR